MINKLTLAFGAVVALVILVDLATGQGPPVYTNYLQAQNAYAPPQPMPPQPLYPIGYAGPKEYDSKKLDKEYEKAIELGKVEHKHPHSHSHQHKMHSHHKEHEKFAEKDKEYGKYDKDYEKSTPAPGMFSSLSGAWNRISPFARAIHKRSAEAQKAGANETAGATETAGANTPHGEADKPATEQASQGRSMDSYDLMHQKSNGYIYFKVPKHLVCNY